ncbi:MAG TPA: sulfite oxidase-like oxidoreductase [Acidimicrobiia bacterium]|jgi:DMSO/TMAO reductase YedYZ molybdopterin-dependent catalytic subunit|nr:sulfite oxidase-like oxidoreductase [Acidimicrobiia bacterium]
MTFVTRGFRGRRQTDAPAGRVPPGQYVTEDFPVLSAGPTPRISLEDWHLRLVDKHGNERRWDWARFQALETETITVDIHCVTKWSKLDTTWQGVSVDTLLAGIEDPGAHVLIRSFGGYTTNLPTADVTGGKAWVVFDYEGKPLTPEHGGPARLLVPHLYFWKSAKWVSDLEFADVDRRGFWESYGYHNYGDPWREQRYTDD